MGHSPETPPVSAGGGDSKIHDFGYGYWEHTIVGKHAKWHYSTQPIGGGVKHQLDSIFLF
jgi:hypothetical protein